MPGPPSAAASKCTRCTFCICNCRSGTIGGVVQSGEWYNRGRGQRRFLFVQEKEWSLPELIVSRLPVPTRKHNTSHIQTTRCTSQSCPSIISPLINSMKIKSRQPKFFLISICDFWFLFVVFFFFFFLLSSFFFFYYFYYFYYYYRSCCTTATRIESSK
jgi:hypothetical protein